MKIIRLVRFGHVLFSDRWGTWKKPGRGSAKKRQGRVVCLLCRIAQAALRVKRGLVVKAWCYFHALRKFKIAAVEW